ncbi:hypothetical protein PHLGIDRAFT_106791 [Phlebiopsis gigantea 11061_1 CR5-6]|uniref:Uncharacterized protein n=1 Tax=Phlebiopsis gigantea (strain 11061_1 CR5-6) TaxID=745531 RepID=A0A0C3NNE5_PHLG1|nr:hypothetical protein PHLGIDRAFT_106791 [Phlebiopsis gigantea 11061_1 CR5-6]
MALSFPAPIGGVPLKEDFAPSIVFACAFAILIVVGAYRLAKPATRTLLILGPFLFSVERVVTWSLRASQARNPPENPSRSLTIYFQVTLAVGYISPLWGCIVHLLRCVFVATTQVHSREPEAQTSNYDDPALQQDKPRLRFWYRLVFGVVWLQQWLPVGTGTAMANLYVDAENNAKDAQGVQFCVRYITTITSLFLVCVLHLATVYAYIIARGKNRRPIIILFILVALLGAIADYDLIAITNWTTALSSTAPGSQNTHVEKIAFYIFRAAPEVLIAGSLLILEVRPMFGTGPWGDPIRDPRPRSESTEPQNGPRRELPRWMRATPLLAFICGLRRR